VSVCPYTPQHEQRVVLPALGERLLVPKVCICVCICVCVCVFINIFVYVCVSVSEYGLIFSSARAAGCTSYRSGKASSVSMCVCVYVYVCVGKCVCVCLLVRAHILCSAK